MGNPCRLVHRRVIEISELVLSHDPSGHWVENRLERNKTRERKWKWREVDKFKMRPMVRMDGVRNGLGDVGRGKET